MQKLYACAELAQYLIKAHAKAHSWNLETWPGKVRLPGDILRPLPNAEATNEVYIHSSWQLQHLTPSLQILKTVYLSEEALSWLAEKSKQPADPKVRDFSQPSSA